MDGAERRRRKEKQRGEGGTRGAAGGGGRRGAGGVRRAYLAGRAADGVGPGRDERRKNEEVAKSRLLQRRDGTKELIREG